MMNVKNDVNSTLGGLGDNCNARHKAANTLSKDNLRVFLEWDVMYMDG
jgi:hypothetical protein